MKYDNSISVFDRYGILNLDGRPFYFDIDDLPTVQSRRWYMDKDGYLTHSYIFRGQRRFVRFHRVIMNAQPNQVVDHINQNRFDNRKENLRLCTRTENDRNRGLYRTNKSGVTGVHFDSKRSKWIASITYNSKRIFIGRYDVEAEAIKARLHKEVELFKDFAPQRKLLEVYG